MYGFPFPDSQDSSSYQPPEEPGVGQGGLEDLPFDLPPREAVLGPSPPSTPEPARAPASLPRLSVEPEPAPSRRPSQEEEGMVSPWETPPALLARIQEHDAAGNYRAYGCSCAEFLNSVAHKETFGNLAEGAEVRVYPDCVGVVGKPGCIEAFLDNLPPGARMVLGVVLLPLTMLTMAGGCINFAIGGAILLAILAFVVFCLVTFPLPTIGILVALFLVGWGVSWMYQRQLERMMRRILEDPTSSYAVRNLHQLMDLAPRYWARGQEIGAVVQIVRIDTRRRMLKRSLVLLVQDNLLELKPGCMLYVVAQMALFFGRLIRPERRVYVLCMDQGKEEADTVARELSEALGVPVIEGAFRLNSLRLR